MAEASERYVTVRSGGGKLAYPFRSYMITNFAVTDTKEFARVLLTKANNCTRTQGNRPVFLAADTLYTDRGGIFISDIDVVEGTIIVIQMSMSRAGTRVADSSIFLRVRQNGSLINCLPKLVIPAGVNSSVGGMSAFLGRADVLSLEEISRIAPRNYVNTYCDQAEFEECWEVSVVSDQVAPPPVYETIEVRGKGAVQIEVKTMPRRMRLRR